MYSKLITGDYTRVWRSATDFDHMIRSFGTRIVQESDRKNAVFIISSFMS